MGQEVKNPLRAQSKYGLMESSAKTGKFCFRGSLEHFLDKNAILDRTPPHLHINCSLHVWGRVQGSQIFKGNSIISICSKVMAFLVILLSPWSPHHPHHPHVIPIAPRRSHVVPMAVVSMVSSVVSVVSTPCCARGPHGPHVIPTSSLCHPRHPHSPQKVPMAVVSVVSSVVSVVSTPCCPRGPHVIPMSSLSSPHHLEGPHIIPNPQDTHSTHPHPPWGWGAPNHKKSNKIWTNRDILILFEDLKSVKTPPPMGGCMDWWVDGWVNGWVNGWVYRWDQVKSLKIE